MKNALIRVVGRVGCQLNVGSLTIMLFVHVQLGSSVMQALLAHQLRKQQVSACKFPFNFLAKLKV